MTNDQVTVQKIAQELKINREILRLTLTEGVNVKKVHAKMILQNLSSEKKLGERSEKNFFLLLGPQAKTDI